MRTTALVLILLASAAAAQEKPADCCMLSGPRVQEDRVPGLERTFGETAMRDRIGRAGRIPPEVLRRAVLVLRDAPEEIRLTPEQAASIRAALAEHRRALRDAPPERAGQQRADRPGRTDRPRRPAGERRPPPGGVGDVQVRIWSTLTEPQREHVLAQVERWRSEREHQRAREYVQKRLQDRRAAGHAPGAAEPRPGRRKEGRDQAEERSEPPGPDRGGQPRRRPARPL